MALTLCSCITDSLDNRRGSWDPLSVSSPRGEREWGAQNSDLSCQSIAPTNSKLMMTKRRRTNKGDQGNISPITVSSDTERHFSKWWMQEGCNREVRPTSHWEEPCKLWIRKWCSCFRLQWITVWERKIKQLTCTFLMKEETLLLTSIPSLPTAWNCHADYRIIRKQNILYSCSADVMLK